ncbi:MAG TPA: hypothetical protein VKK61_02745 [Tepidisphaeraceae bacterium]|nr:hypothetical protein [Tepidisphaeraceae bacterium]
MRGFTVVDLSPQCEVKLREQYDYGLLEKIDGAIDLVAALSAEIWRSPDGFDITLPRTESRLKLRWRASAKTAGIATINDSDGGILSLSLLATGINPDADKLTLQAFQTHALRELHDTGFEASFELSELNQRPLIATVGLFMPTHASDRWTFALTDRCFAAAYFRYHQLA